MIDLAKMIVEKRQAEKRQAKRRQAKRRQAKGRRAIESQAKIWLLEDEPVLLCDLLPKVMLDFWRVGTRKWPRPGRFSTARNARPGRTSTASTR